MTYKFPLATSTWDQSEIEAMQLVIGSQRFTMGQKVQSFEQAFKEYFGSRHAIMVNSGSSANLLMIASLFFCKNNDIKLHRGDEVIVPAVSWSTTYTPLQQFGLKVKFVDIDLDTLNFDLQKLDEAISEKTRAILSVNLLGNSNDFVRIAEIIAGREIVVLEDNCESMGATFEGRYTGTFGVMGTFSSFFSHHISTMEGGIILTDDDELAQILCCLRAHGWTRDLPKQNFVSGTKSDDKFTESFNFVLPGYNVRPLELSGAIGLEQLTKLPDIVSGRQANGKKFQKMFVDHPLIQIQSEIGNSSWFGFSVVLREGCGVSRRSLLEKLEKHGFESRPIVAGNFTKNPVLEYFDYSIHDELVNAEFVDNHGLFIGNHHYPMDHALEELENCFNSF